MPYSSYDSGRVPWSEFCGLCFALQRSKSHPSFLSQDQLRYLLYALSHRSQVAQLDPIKHALPLVGMPPSQCTKQTLFRIHVSSVRYASDRSNRKIWPWDVVVGDFRNPF